MGDGVGSQERGRKVICVSSFTTVRPEHERILERIMIVEHLQNTLESQSNSLNPRALRQWFKLAMFAKR